MSSSFSRSSVIKHLLTRACILYTVIVTLLCLLLMLISEGASRAVSPLNFLLVFPFALIFSLANYIDRHTRLNGLLKFAIHAIFTIGGFFVFLYLPAFAGASESGSLVVLAVFTVIYLIVYGTVLLFRSRWKKEISSASDYKPQFSRGDERNQRR